MSRVNTIVWGVLLAFGAFVIHESLDHKYYGSDFGPGPGFFSFWLGILLMVLSLDPDRHDLAPAGRTSAGRVHPEPGRRQPDAEHHRRAGRQRCF